jgi:hypothetical protein
MAEASKPRRLHPTSMYAYTCKVLQQLDMLWMDTWVYPYADMPLKVGVDYWEIGGMAESE